MIGKLRHGIQQFWSGKAQKCEKENLLTHLEAEADEIKAQFEQEYEKDLRRGPDLGLAPEKKEQLFAIILQRIAVTHGVPVVQWQQKTYRWQIAVAILLLLGLGVAVAVRNSHHGVNTEIAEAAELNYIVRQNLGVQEQEVPLPDGSKIILAPNAAVHYRHDYGQYNRAITVRTGTVTFQVAKDKTKPFVVTAAWYTVTALGTVFKVHMLEKETLKVHLLEGKVVVKALKADPNVKDVYLNPGEEWQLDPRQDVKALKPLLWQQERFARFEKEAQSTYQFGARNLVLHYDDTPLPTVIEQLKAIYPVDFEFYTDDLKGIRFSGKLPIPNSALQPNSLDTVLQLLFKNCPVLYHRYPNKVIINLLPPS